MIYFDVYMINIHICFADFKNLDNFLKVCYTINDRTDSLGGVYGIFI